MFIPELNSLSICAMRMAVKNGLPDTIFLSSFKTRSNIIEYISMLFTFLNDKLECWTFAFTA